MGNNLRARLARIREQRDAPALSPGKDPPGENPGGGGEPASLALTGWVSAGYQVLKRSVTLPLPDSASFPLPPALGILAPDLFRYGPGLSPGDLCFFDLETTGLSRGAGTLAFLAAFGRLTAGDGPSGGGSGEGDGPSGGGFKLRVDQYLLLDYPGETAFLEALLPEFHRSPRPLVVSYNGKTFDAQILSTRCLMNGLLPPEYAHADLLHPSRRLWRRVLPSCSQGMIETLLPGIDRTGDVPGALAPDIWFSFLKTGDPGALLGICDHNVRDISGLTRLFFALAEIAASPLTAGEKYRCDLEGLALHWRKWRRLDRALGDVPAETGAALLAEAAARGYPRVLYVTALDLLREGRREAARERLLELTRRDGPPGLLAAAYRALAVDAEWRGKDPEAALAYTGAALALDGARSDAYSDAQDDAQGAIGEALRRDLVRRRERLSARRGKPQKGGGYAD